MDGKARVLVDAGEGSCLRFGASGAQMADLDVVLLSHLHSDHSADFPVLVKSSHFEPRVRKAPLPVRGPPGTKLMPSASEFIAETLGKEAQIQSVIGARYKGPIAFANDLDCYAVAP